MATFVSNFVGGTSKSNWSKLGSGYTQNMYLETKDQNDHFFSRVLLPIPGQKHLISMDGTPRGIYNAVGGYDGETVYCVVAGTLYCIVDGSPLSIGNVGTGKIDFAELRNAEGSFLLVSDGANLLAVDMSVVPAMQQAIQVPLPQRVNADGTYGDNIHPTSVCVCYSMVNVVDEGTDRFYTSVTLPFKRNEDGSVNYDCFAVTEEPGTEDGSERPYYRIGYYTYAETRADSIVRLVSNGTSLFAIGEKSFDRFDYTGVAISKSVVSGVVWKCPRGQGGFYGTDERDSVAVLNGSVYYVARNPDGGRSVVVLGDGIQAISTPEIDASLSKVLTSTSFQWGQHPFYVIRMTDSTIAYDIREGVWVNLSTGDGTWDIVRCVASGGKVLVQYEGGIGAMTSDKWTDHEDRPIVRKRAGIIKASGAGEIQVDCVKLHTNAGQYEDDGSECHATFRWSSDGSTWEDTGIEELGRVGQYEREMSVYDLGIGSSFNIEISTSDNVPFCIYGISVDAVVCDI